MNRKERRDTEKKMGLTSHYRTLSRKEKFNLISDRIKYGKEKEKEMKENIRIYKQEFDEGLESKCIFSLSETIAKQKNIPMMDAIVEAQKRYKINKVD